MEDCKTEDGLLNEASLWVPLGDMVSSEPTPPQKISIEEEHWSKWTAEFVSERIPMPRTPPVGVFVLKDDEPGVDPWDVVLNLDPPFYRRVFMHPPYVSGMPNI